MQACFMSPVQAVCGQMNPIFATSQHQDSQELLAFLLAGLNEGLNKVDLSFHRQIATDF